MENIIQEKISADHLLYVSLKYTKTGDVILNLLARWRSMIDKSFSYLLENAYKHKKIKDVPTIPRQRVEVMKALFKDNEDVIKSVELYEFFNKIPSLEKMVEHEYRKNLTLKVLYMGQWIDINMDKLKEYNTLIAKFIIYVRQSEKA